MIYIHNQSEANLNVDETVFERSAFAALQYAEVQADADLSVIISDDAYIHELNLKFRKIDSPTDVLAFPSEETDIDTGRTYLGDVILSRTRAQAQAQAAGHALESELQLLVVHGVLHLLGYDHTDEESKGRMWTAQGEILESLGLPHEVISSLNTSVR
ncbi:MAG: rRNA maturation RNase YbeY [Chloroflexota bacterium]|nr:rRNA maturation RNase YbeY [Chloroflexota bacterium]